MLFQKAPAEVYRKRLFDLIQLIRDELIDPMDVVDHEEGGNRASFDAAVGYGSAAVQRVAVFLVKSFFGKSNGARIAVDGFQIDRAESGENVFRAVRAVLVMRNDDRALIGDGVDGIFQKIAFSEKSVIERKSADEDEKYAEKTEWSAYCRCGNRPEYRESYPEYCEDRKNGTCLRYGNFPGSARPEERFVIAQKGL